MCDVLIAYQEQCSANRVPPDSVRRLVGAVIYSQARWYDSAVVRGGFAVSRSVSPVDLREDLAAGGCKIR